MIFIIKALLLRRAFSHIKNFFANNKIVLTFAIVLYIILIFPIFINVKLMFQSDKSQLFYSIYLFNLIKLVDGYIKFSQSCLINNVNYKKKKIIPYKNLFLMKNQIKFLYDYHVVKITSLINIGVLSNLETKLYLSNFLDFTFNNVIKVVKEYKNYVKTNYFINLIENKNNFEIYISVNFVFNIITLLFSFIKYISEKIKNGKFEKKQNKYSRGNVAEKYQ